MQKESKKNDTINQINESIEGQNKENKSHSQGEKIIAYIQKHMLFLQIFLYILISILFFEFLLTVFSNVAFFTSKIVFSIIYAFLFAALLSLINHKIMRNALLIIGYVVGTALYVVEAVYFRAFKSIALISAIRKAKDLNGVEDSIWSFVSVDLLFFLIPIIVLLIALIIQAKNKNTREPETTWKAACLRVCLPLLLLATANYIYINVNDDVNKEQFRNSTLYFKQYGLVDTIFKEVMMKVTNGSEKYVGAETTEMKEAFTYVPEKNAKSSIYDGKNLIFIEAESIGPYVIDEKLTPALYKLQQEGYYFDNYYSDRDNTLNSEYAMIKSFYLTDNKLNNYKPNGSMPTLFKENGYTATAYHNNIGGFYERDVNMLDLGFDQFYDIEQLDAAAKGSMDMLGEFPSDTVLFEKSFPFYAKTKSPFMAYHITISGHAPYDVSKRPSLSKNLKEVKKVYPEYPEIIQGYYAASMETDKGVQILLADLEKADLLEDTVIVFVGDHYSYSLGTELIEDTFGLSSLDQYKVPLIIWDASKPAEKVTDLAGNVDILPTLANMFDLNLEHTMGKDIFSTNKKDVIVEWHGFRSYSILTPEGGYDGDSLEKVGELNKGDIELLLDYTYRREEWNDSEYVRNEIGA